MARKAEPLKTEIRHVPLAAIDLLEKNARYMTSDQQTRLTENIKTDGLLTSAPLLWLQQNDKGEPLHDPVRYLCISGNHRVTSARAAGVESADCIVITTYLSSARRTELQLAHNAVTGQDDVSILQELYESLDLLGKEYSGLTDNDFDGLADLSLAGFSVAAPTYQEINLSFLPEDAEEFQNLLQRAGKSKAIIHAAHIDDFDAMFDTIVRVKEEKNIINSGMAIHAIVALANERLDQIEQEKDQADDLIEEPGDE